MNRLSSFIVLSCSLLMSALSSPFVSAQTVIAQRVNPSNPCPHGGKVAGVNCRVFSFKNRRDNLILVPNVKYWVSVEYAGVYYKPENGECNSGGGRVGANCKLAALDGLLTRGIDYWVDTNPQYPGVYYRQSK
ncbi:MAG: hypothetical protein ACK6DE_03320 [Pseudanabaena sp.]|jgi:hypothetical protein